MKVLVVSHVLGRRHGGGVAARALGMARSIGEHGASVRLLGTDVHLEPTDREDLRGLDVALIPGGLTRFPLPLVGPARLAGFVGWADVVVLFSHWTILNAAVHAACRRLGVPHIVCPCGALPVRGRSQAIKRTYDAVVGRRLVREAAAAVATTPLERQQLLATQAMPARVVVIPNAVDACGRPELDSDGRAASAGFRRELGLGAAPIVLFMGRLNPIKGPDLLVEAFARVSQRVPEPQLVVAGPDEGMRQDLIDLAARRGIADRVRFIGRLDHGRTPPAYRAAALLVVPSRSEAMSLVAIEAGAVGTPVLMTDACGFDVGAFGGGLTVPATIDGLAGGLERLLAQPHELADMGARLRAHVAASHAWPVVGRQWLDLCVEVARPR